MDNSLHEKLKAIENSLPEIEKQLSEIDISKDQKGYAEMAKKHSDVSIIVDLFNEWKKVTSEIEDAVELINSEEDEDMKNEFESEREEIKNHNDRTTRFGASYRLTRDRVVFHIVATFCVAKLHKV